MLTGLIQDIFYFTLIINMLIIRFNVQQHV